MPPAPQRLSPYEAVLGDELSKLHPRLATYFAAIPSASSGIGTGTFDVAGTPRRWLWPILWVLGKQGVMFPAWEHDLAFTVFNHPVVDARGNPAIVAIRTFHFSRGDRRMRDAITAEHGGLVDHLGVVRRYVAGLDCAVVDGSLRLASTILAIRIGNGHIRIPRFIAPKVTLLESFDDESDSQRVSVTVELPLVGRLYEYSGCFSYEIRPGEKYL
ncbi:DUF4166 domain-containing protein [Glaciihabitans sp. UYNi722]|uniref:DUF4166 domain-containing protein n=1 Tax=Glaciihabitans sp. UYNi722 TaxID=3156344 RepID=UPI0033949284